MASKFENLVAAALITTTTLGCGDTTQKSTDIAVCQQAITEHIGSQTTKVLGDDVSVVVETTQILFPNDTVLPQERTLKAQKLQAINVVCAEVNLAVSPADPNNCAAETAGRCAKITQIQKNKDPNQ